MDCLSQWMTATTRRQIRGSWSTYSTLWSMEQRLYLFDTDVVVILVGLFFDLPSKHSVTGFLRNVYWVVTIQPSVSTSLRYTTIYTLISAIWDFGTVPVAQRISSCSTQSRITALKYGRPSLKISGKQQQPPLSSKCCSSKSQPSSLCL